MASVASQLVEEVTADTQTDSLEDAREICADGTYFPNNLRMSSVHAQKFSGSPFQIGHDGFLQNSSLTFTVPFNTKI